MPDNRKVLYEALKEKNLYSKSEQEFYDQFSTPERQALLHKAMEKKGLYTKGEVAFRKQFFETADQQQPIEELLQPIQQEKPREQPVIEAQHPEAFKETTAGPTQDLSFQEQVDQPPKASRAAKMGRVESAVAQFTRAIYSLPGDLLKVIGIGAAKLGNVAEGEEKYSAQDAITYQIGDWYHKAINELAPTNPEYQGELQEQVAQATGDLVALFTGGGIAKNFAKAAPQMITSAVAEAPIKVAAADLAKGLVSPEGVIGATQMGVSEYEEAKQAGASEDEAFEVFIRNAAVGSVLERIPMQLFWKRLDNVTGGGVKEVLAKGVSGGLEEMSTEVLQQAYSNKTAQEIYDETRSIVDGMTESGGIGFGLGFLLNAMGVRLRGLKSDAKSEEEIESFQNALHYVEQKQNEVDKQVEQAQKLENDATKEGKIPKDDQPEHPETEEGGLPTETERSDSPEPGGEVETEKAPEESVQPEPEPEDVEDYTPEELSRFNNLKLKTKDGKNFKTRIVDGKVEAFSTDEGSEETHIYQPSELLEKIQKGAFEVGTQLPATTVHPELSVLEGKLGKIPKKGEKIDIQNKSGEISIQPIPQKTYKQLDVKDALAKSTAKDELRPAMTGIYHDSENQQLVVTDGHMLVVIPQKIEGESYIEPTKNSGLSPEVEKITEKFPDYMSVIPTDATHFIEGMDLKSFLDQIKGQSKAQKFIDDGVVPTVLEFDDGRTIGFNPQVIEKAITPLIETGTKNINFEASETNRAAIIRDSDNPDKFALVMPIMLRRISDTNETYDTDPIEMVYSRATDQQLKENPKATLEKLRTQRNRMDKRSDKDILNAKDIVRIDKQYLEKAKKMPGPRETTNQAELDRRENAIKELTEALQKSEERLERAINKFDQTKKDLDERIKEYEERVSKQPSKKKPTKSNRKKGNYNINAPYTEKNDVLIVGNYLFNKSEVDPNREYHISEGILVENVPSNRKNVKGQEYFENGKPEDAIELLDKVKSLPKGKSTQKNVLDVAFKDLQLDAQTYQKAFGPQNQLKPNLFEGLDSYQKAVRNHLKKLPKLNQAVSDNQIAQWYREALTERLQSHITGKSPVEQVKAMGDYVGQEIINEFVFQKPAAPIKRGPFRDRIRNIGKMERDFKSSPSQEKYDAILNEYKMLWQEGEMGQPTSPQAAVELGKEIDQLNKMASDKIKKVDTDKYIDDLEADYAKETKKPESKYPLTAKGNKPNDLGVYEGEESLQLKNKRKDWKGGPDAEIKLTQLENGKWISAIDANTSNEGIGEPLTSRNQFNTKEEAITDAANRLLKWIDSKVDSKNKSEAQSAARIQKWAQDQLPPPFEDHTAQGGPASPLIGNVREGKADVKGGERIAPSPIIKYDKKGVIIRPKAIVDILKDLRKNIDKLATTVGALKYTKDPIPGRRNIIGAYSPFYQTIAMKTVGDLDTTSHELGHALDFAYGLKKDLPNDIYGKVWQELKPFSKHGSTPPPGHPNPGEYELKEGIAEWIRAYIVNPQEATEAAPIFEKWYRETLPGEAHKVIEEFSEDVRILEGASGFDAINAHVEIIPQKTFAERWKATKDEFLEALRPHTRNPQDFKLTWVDKLKQKFTDSMQPYVSTIKFAASVGNIDLNKVLPSNNPLIMARLFLGRNSKVQNFIEKGLVEFNTDRRVIDDKTGEVVSLGWILEPFDTSDRSSFDEEQRQMIAYGIALRTQELPLKYVENQIKAALDKGQIIPSSILYSNKRFYDKFFERNEQLREDLYSQNERFNNQIKKEAEKTESKINKAFADKRAKLENILSKQQEEINSERQKYYDQKGKMPERERIEKLRILERNATEAKETFEKAIDGIELERFKAIQNLQGLVDGKMDQILKKSVLANIKQPRGKRFTGIGGNLVGEQKLAQKTIDQFNELSSDKQDRIKEGLRRYRVFADNILKYLTASGRISKESYDAIKANNEEYFMLQRVIQAKPGENLESPSLPQSKAFGVATEVIYSIKGSAHTIKNPYEALLSFAHKSIIEADRNYVLKSYVNFMQQAIKAAGPDAGRISGILSPAVQGDKNTVYTFQGGEKKYWQLDKDIYRSMKGIVDQLYALPPIVRFFPKLLRASVTNNPVFAARNLLRDYQTMLVVSDNVKSIKDIVPTKTGKVGDLEPKDAYDVFGANQGGYHLLSENFYNKTLEEKSTELAGKKGNILVKASDMALHAVESFGKLSEGSEKITRMAEFKNSFKRSKKQGLDDYNAALKAAYDARSLMDFAVIGEWMNVVNQLIPFTNAKIQGLRVAKRGFVRNPALFSMKAGLTIMLPQIISRMMMSDEDEERYLQLPEYQRNMFWNIPVGTGWLLIPKPHDIAIAATMADMTYDTAMGHEMNYTGFNTAIFALLPMTRADMAGPMRTFVEVSANKDFFRDSNIVPAYEDKKALELRNYQWASNIGKFIGEKIGVDPRKVDHFIRGTTSYFGSQAMRLSDMGREDKKRNVADMTGFYKEEPIYNYKDVQWAQDQALKYGLETEEYYMVLRWMIQEYSLMESDSNKRQMSKAIRDYSGYLKELWQSYGIHEEAVNEYRQDFKDAVRKEAENVTNTPFIKELKRAREERKELEDAY